MTRKEENKENYLRKKAKRQDLRIKKSRKFRDKLGGMYVIFDRNSDQIIAGNKIGNDWSLTLDDVEVILQKKKKSNFLRRKLLTG